MDKNNQKCQWLKKTSCWFHESSKKYYPNKGAFCKNEKKKKKKRGREEEGGRKGGKKAVLEVQNRRMNEIFSENKLKLI